jgi:VanZ family protein
MHISLVVFGTALFLGISTEIFQLVFTALNRTASGVDFMLDLAGSLAGIASMWFIMK